MTREQALERSHALNESLSSGSWSRADIVAVADAILASSTEDTNEADTIVRMQAAVILQLRLELARAKVGT